MSLYGPWDITPSACNSSLQCQDQLRNFSIGTNSSSSIGIAICFESLQIERDSFGGCACDNTYALGGNNCLETTSATSGTLGFLLVALFITILTILRFSLTFIQLIKYRILNLNAAGTTYVFTWVALLASLLSVLSEIARLYSVDQSLISFQRIIGRIEIIFLTISVLNLVAAFVEMSSSVRLIHNVERYRVHVIVTTILIAALVIIPFLLLSPIISASIAFVVVVFIAVLGIFGPVLFYIRSAKNMIRDGHIVLEKKVTNFQLYSAMCWEVFGGSQKMLNLLGFSRSSSSGLNHSKSSRGEDITHSKFRAGSKEEEPTTTNGVNHLFHGPKKREEKMISFLSRSLRMGFWCSLSLLAFLAGTGYSIAIELGPYDDNPNFKERAIGTMIQHIALSSALYQILWFLNLSYRKAILKFSHQSAMNNSKFDSKVDSKLESRLENDKKVTDLNQKYSSSQVKVEAYVV